MTIKVGDSVLFTHAKPWENKLTYDGVVESLDDYPNSIQVKVEPKPEDGWVVSKVKKFSIKPRDIISLNGVIVCGHQHSH